MSLENFEQAQSRAAPRVGYGGNVTRATRRRSSSTRSSRTKRPGASRSSRFPPNDTQLPGLDLARARARHVPRPTRSNGRSLAVVQDQVAAGAMLDDLEHARGDEARELYSALLLARLVRQRHHAPARAFRDQCHVLALTAARFARAYTFTAHAKDIFHESVSPTTCAETGGRGRDGDVSDSTSRTCATRSAPGAARRAHLQRHGRRPPVLRTARRASPLILSAGRLVRRRASTT